MANTIAIDSKEGPRTKPNGSQTFLCASYPRFWGEIPDDIRLLQSSSGNLGRFPGRHSFFAIIIRVSGESSRMGACNNVRRYTKCPILCCTGPSRCKVATPWYCFRQKAVKVYRKTMQNVDFQHCLSLKQPNSGQGVLGLQPTVTKQNVL